MNKAVHRLVAIATMALLFYLPSIAQQNTILISNFEQGPQSCLPATPLELTATISNAPLQPNQTFFTTAVVNNCSESTLDNVQLTLLVPENTSGFASASASITASGCSGSFCNPPEQARWDLGTLTPGESRAIQIPNTVTNDTSVFGETITQQFSVDFTNNTTAITTELNAEVRRILTSSQLAVTISSSQQPLAPGDEHTFTITYSNSGTGAATGVELTTTLPTNSTFVSASGGGTLVGNTIRWSIGTLPADSGSRHTFTVRETTSRSGEVLFSEARIRDDDGNEFDARASTAAVTHSERPLALVVALDRDPLTQNGAFLTTAVVSNTSSSDILDDVELRLRSPLFTDGFANAAASPNVSGNCSGSFCSPLKQPRWDLGTLAPGESRTIQFPNTVINDATAFGQLIIQRFEARYANNPAPIVTFATAIVERITTNHEFGVEISSTEAQPLNPADEVRFVIDYSNAGTSAATGVELVATLPTNTTFISASDGGSLVGNTVRWAIGALPADSADRRFLVVRETTGHDGSVLFTEARIRSDSTSDSDFDARASTAAVSHSDWPLTMAIAVDRDPLNQSETFLTTVIVSNTSAFDVLDNVELRLRSPLLTGGFANAAASIAVSGDCSGSFCSPLKQPRWDLGTLTPGESRTIQVPNTVIHDDAAFGQLISQRFEARYTNNPAFTILAANTPVVRAANGANLETTLLPSDVPLAPGAEQIFRLSYVNTGSSQASDAELRVPLPAGVSFQSADAGGLLDVDVVRWSLGSIAAGSGAYRQLIVREDSNASGRILSAQAQIGEVGVMPFADQAGSASAISDPGPLQITAVANQNTLQGDQAFTLSATVSNTSNADVIDNVRLVLRVPQNITGFANAAATPAVSGGCRGSFCNSLELARWDLGTFSPNDSETIQIPTSVVAANDLTTGTVVARFEIFYDQGAISTQAIETLAIIIGNLKP